MLATWPAAGTQQPYADVLLRPWYAWLDAIELKGEHCGQLVVYYRVWRWFRMIHNNNNHADPIGEERT